MNKARTANLLVVFMLSLCVLLAGCKTSMKGRVQTANDLAAPAFLLKRPIEAPPFILTAFEHVADPGGTANLYIGGDGLAWINRGTPSSDPTPVNPVALALAAADPAANVIYLARPCQYTGLASGAPCPDKYWTSHRSAPEVVIATNIALDDIKSRYGFKSFNLIGYSGGAAIAVLVAVRRDDIASIRTVAGNLDHETLNRFHGVSLQPASLNPVNVAREIAHIPQHHFLGGRDETVVPFVYQSFREASGETPCLHHTVIDDAAHETGWVEKWPSLLQLPVRCDR